MNAAARFGTDVNDHIICGLDVIACITAIFKVDHGQASGWINCKIRTTLASILIDFVVQFRGINAATHANMSFFGGRH